MSRKLKLVFWGFWGGSDVMLMKCDFGGVGIKRLEVGDLGVVGWGVKDGECDDELLREEGELLEVEVKGDVWLG